MTITAHAVTGSLVAVATGDIYIGVITALTSHFLIDMIPHWDEGSLVAKRKYIPWADLAVGSLIIILLCLTINAPVALIMAGAIAGVAPDLMWLPQVLYGKPSPHGKNTLLHWLRRKHEAIQPSETTKGILVEAVWVFLILVLIYKNYS